MFIEEKADRAHRQLGSRGFRSFGSFLGWSFALTLGLFTLYGAWRFVEDTIALVDAMARCAY